MQEDIRVALAGNPNSGKTTIFNNLTGSRQHVGNYPGVTVERKEGFLKHNGRRLLIVDLPGIYSLSAYSSEELVTRDFLLKEKPDAVVDIIDCTNLERNLYFAVQLMELKTPLVLAFNMSDAAEKMGMEFDLDKLSGLLRTPIIKTVGSKGNGMNDVLRAAVGRAEDKTGSCGTRVDYGEAVEREIASLEREIRKDSSFEGYDSRWVAVKLLESDKELLSKLDNPAIKNLLKESSKNIISSTGEAPENAIVSARYRFISEACRKTVKPGNRFERAFSDYIDAVVANRVLGIPIFLGLMYLVFQLTFTIGDPFMGYIETFFAFISEKAAGLWPKGSESLLKSLIIDGIIGGVGGVVVFLPNILLLFLAIAILEDSGYMARAAFIMDKVMHKIGLHGKSFIPLLIGFGCSVPAVMATRTLESRRDRLITMTVVPLMSCGARLPIYALIIPAFFPQSLNAPMLWIIYMIGIVLAVASAKALGLTVFKGEPVPFVMELPPYRMPTLKGITIHMWERGWLYLKKAGTIILALSILLWALTTFPRPSEETAVRFEDMRAAVEISGLVAVIKEKRIAEINNAETENALENSIAGRVGKFIEPALAPIGFDWKIGTALIGAFAAKEVFVSQMGIIYSVGEADEESESLRSKLSSGYSPLVGFCIMLFCLVSAPCMATVAAVRRESGSWKWAMFQLLGLTVMAYVLTFIVFQVGRFFNIGA